MNPTASPSSLNQRITLAMELSNPSASSGASVVALFAKHGDEHRLIDSAPIKKGARGSDGLMALIEQLCTKNTIAPKQISTLIVSVGPGGYTSLRISTTSAKVLALTLGCSLIAVPSDQVAAQAIGKHDRPALIALASKNQHTHASVLDVSGEVRTLGMIDADAIESLGVKAIYADAHLPESFQQRAASLGIFVRPIILDAIHCAKAAVGISPTDPERLEPIYAREPDAITQWRARHGD